MCRLWVLGSFQMLGKRCLFHSSGAAGLLHCDSHVSPNNHMDHVNPIRHPLTHATRSVILVRRGLFIG